MGVAFGPYAQLPEFPDHVDLIEVADEEHPFRLATSPARSFLNSTLCRDAVIAIQEGGRPEVLVHPDDARGLGIANGDIVEIGNKRGEVVLHAKLVRRRAARRGHRRGALAERRA